MYPGYGMGFFSNFGLFGVIWLLIAGLFLGCVILFLVQGLRQRSKDNHSPKLTVSAVVITKRTKVSGGHGSASASTWYYVTFQVDSGDRMEFSVTGQEYGQLAEGDRGSLTFQGSRYLGFKRG